MTNEESQNRVADQHQHVIPAPDWLKERMNNLIKSEMPELDEVERQLEASARIRKAMLQNT